MTQAPYIAPGRVPRFTAALRFAIALFLILQGLALLFDTPVALFKYTRSLVMAMPLLGIAADWAIAALAVAFMHLCIALPAGLVFWLLVRRPGLAQAWERLLLFLSGLGAAFLLLSSLLDEWRGSLLAPHWLTSGYMVMLAALLLAALASRRWRDMQDAISLRLRRLGLVLTLASLLLSPLWFVNEGGGAAVSPPREASPNIILLVIDTLSAPAMSLYGATLPTTPRLEKFAATGTVLDRFIAGSNTTTPSVATFLSGAYPSRNHVQQMGGYFTSGQGELLPERLRNAGYRTAAITANSSAHAGRLHIAQGFDNVIFTGSPCRPMQKFWSRLGNTNLLGMDAYFERQTRLNAWLARLLCRGVTVTDVPSEVSYARALQWLDEGVPSKRPFFLWLQTLPPHDPYLPPSPFSRAFDKSARFTRYDDAGQQYLYKMNPGPAEAAAIATLRNRYAENVAYADHAAGEFLDALGRRGLLQNTIVVVTSDHGESFGRWIGHQGPFLDQALISVPLIVSGPGIGKGLRVPDLASHADLAPTLLDLAGLPAGAAMQGRSLRGLFAGGSLPPRPIFSMQIETSARSGPVTSGTIAVLDGTWKYVRYLQDGREELFDLSRDPAEARNLATSRADIAGRLRGLAQQRLVQDER